MVPDGEASFKPCQGILVDDLGHPDDIVAGVTIVYEKIDHVVLKPEELRRSLARDFFQNHIRAVLKEQEEGTDILAIGYAFSKLLGLAIRSRLSWKRGRGDCGARRLDLFDLLLDEAQA